MTVYGTRTSFGFGGGGGGPIAGHGSDAAAEKAAEQRAARAASLKAMIANNTIQTGSLLPGEETFAFCSGSCVGFDVAFGGPSDAFFQAAAALFDSLETAPQVYYKGTPPGSVLYYTPDGKNSFYAPQSANFGNEFNDGFDNAVTLAISGAISAAIQMNSNVGQYGFYDFQRNGNLFIGAYTNASNFGVGVYLNGFGLSKNSAVGLSNLFALAMSSNYNTSRRPYYTGQGWQYADQNFR